jgi:hypothetical protein
LGDFLLVNPALNNHADFQGEDDCSLLASDQNTKYEWVLQRISVCLFELILLNTINSLGLRKIENSIRITRKCSILIVLLSLRYPSIRIYEFVGWLKMETQRNLPNEGKTFLYRSKNHSSLFSWICKSERFGRKSFPMKTARRMKSLKPS